PHLDAPSFPTRRSSDLDAATPVCGHRCVEVNRAVRTVRAGKRTLYGTFEWLGAGLAKWRHDPNEVSIAFIAEILAGSDVFSANGDRKSTRLNSSHRTIS